MFKAVISRDHGEPWGSTGMSSAKWKHIGARPVLIADLIATQPGVHFAPLIEHRTPVGGDELPHVIAWRGGLYLEDGHHRAIRAALAGRKTIMARVLHLNT